MKKQTETKLTNLAKLLKAERAKTGDDLLKPENFLSRCRTLSDKSALHLSMNTVKQYKSFLLRLLAEPEQEVEDKVVLITMTYASGKVITHNVYDVAPQQVKAEPKVYFGLIDYNDGKELLKFGKYAGLNLLNDEWRDKFTDEWDYIRFLYSLLSQSRIQQRQKNTLSYDELKMNILSIMQVLKRLKASLLKDNDESYINGRFKEIQHIKSVNVNLLKQMCE